MAIRILEDIGLTKEEISVYLCLIESGTSLSGPIASKAGIPCSKIDDILISLAKKGLITSTIKGENLSYFMAKSPEKLLDYLKKRGHYTKLQLNEVKTLIVELLSKQKAELDIGSYQKEKWEDGPPGG